MNKEKFNKIRVGICITNAICAVCVFLIIVGFRVFAIFSNNETYKELSLKIINGPGILLFLFFSLICTFFLFYNHKKYGPIKFNSEYRIPKIISYQANIKDNIINYLNNNEYIKGNCNLSSMNIDYYINMNNEKDVHLFAFLKSSKINQTILREYKENYLREFLDYIGDNEEKIINGYRFFYIYFIITISDNNKFAEEIINYNLTVHSYVILMPILINQKENKIYIADYNDGIGQTLYKKQQKIVIEKLKSLDVEINNSFGRHND